MKFQKPPQKKNSEIFSHTKQEKEKGTNQDWILEPKTHSKSFKSSRIDEIKKTQDLNSLLILVVDEN